MRRSRSALPPATRPLTQRLFFLPPLCSPARSLSGTYRSSLHFHSSRCSFARFFHQSRSIQHIDVPKPTEDADDVEISVAPGLNRTDPEAVARAILTDLKEGTWQALPTKQRSAKLKALLRDLKQGEGVGRAMFEVSRELGLRTTGRLLPFLYSSQEKGNANRLAYLMLTLTHAHTEAMTKGKARAVGQITNGVIENYGVEDIAKLLQAIPRSPYFSLADGRERRPEEWSPKELGELVGQLKHERAKKRDLEFYMDLLVKLLTTLEKDGGWGREKTVAAPLAEPDSAKRKDVPKSNKPIPVYDLEYVPKVVGPALGPFFDYWGNQDYATIIHCLITAFSQHAVTTYGQQTLNKEMYHHFCVEMMARTAIAAKPTVGMLHYMVNDVTTGWEEDEVDSLSGQLEERMKPHSFFRRWARKLFNQPTPD